jgi:hypothetical protein
MSPLCPKDWLFSARFFLVDVRNPDDVFSKILRGNHLSKQKLPVIKDIFINFPAIKSCTLVGGGFNHSQFINFSRLDKS